MTRFMMIMAVAIATVPGLAASQAISTAATAQIKGAYNSEDTELGTLLDDPAAKAVLVKHLPEITSSDQIDMARSMTLRQMQSFAADRVSDEALKKIDADLAKIPAKK